IPDFSLGGGTTATIVNGILETTVPIAFTGNTTKTFRNGISNSGTIDGFTGNSQKFIINGQSAILGSTGLLMLPATGGLEIASNTTVALTSDKAVKGDISLLSNSSIELGNFNLTDTGSITGGSTNYIKTNGTGALILGNVAGLRNAPIGNSAYNPLTITNTSGHNWSLRVEDALPTVINPTFSGNEQKAVKRVWHITPSQTPTATGADIVFQYDETDINQIGPSFVPGANVQVWRMEGTNWIAASVTQPPGGVPTARIPSITNWSLYSPFAISNFDSPLPIKLISFTAARVSSSRSLVTWELAACCAKEASFELEKSTDGRNYSLLSILTGSETSRQYSYTDSHLAAGTSYYRLKATDADGKITYSRVALVINTSADVLITSLSPNSVSSRATVALSTTKSGTVLLRITDMAGVVVKQWQQTGAAGTQLVSVDLSALPAGMYQLVSNSGGTRAVTRFVKL
ncbi:MAG: T9SS type A sorting domain-containing protein, partial [Chitinophagaceae bacterium]|nr:T9SS type A sorting domain-containing protein [Chitinophagaceae bacterium]